ncbi:MAG: M48 family metallopeptidase [Longimicrobiales bacterium]|nr:M48 family metallopeptidase [Longimicrobiales bacterium]
MRIRALVVLMLALSLASCATTPITGRSRLKPLIPLEIELQLGVDAYAEAKSMSELISSGLAFEMVQLIGQRIAVAAEQMIPEPTSAFDWEFILIDEPETANAWALPGGKTAVYTGLLPITRDENGFAVIMGHEIAHAVLQHGLERITQSLLLEGTLGLASMALGDMSASERDATLQALSGLSSIGIALPFSRLHESEADEVGLYFAAAAGYDPRAAIGFWERMVDSNGDGAPPEILSTHPSHDTRIADLQRWMPTALELYRAGDKELATCSRRLLRSEKRNCET